jgi:hypothetical protein
MSATMTRVECPVCHSQVLPPVPFLLPIGQMTLWEVWALFKRSAAYSLGALLFFGTGFLFASGFEAGGTAVAGEWWTVLFWLGMGVFATLSQDGADMVSGTLASVSKLAWRFTRMRASRRVLLVVFVAFVILSFKVSSLAGVLISSLVMGTGIALERWVADKRAEATLS